MSGRFHATRCDCLSCFGFRLVRDFLVVGLIAVVLISLLVRPDPQPPLLIDERSGS